MALRWYVVHAYSGFENQVKRSLEERVEHFKWTVPKRMRGKLVTLRAVLNYRRMPDSYANFLGIKTRPTLEVGRDEVIIRVQ